MAAITNEGIKKHFEEKFGRQLTDDEVEILETVTFHIQYVKLKEEVAKRISLHSNEPKQIKIAWKTIRDTILQEQSYGYDVDPHDALLDFVMNSIGSYRAGEVIEFYNCSCPEINLKKHEKKENIFRRIFSKQG